VVDSEHEAAKIYHKPVDDNKARKLAAMVKLKDGRLLGIAAWPIDTLHSSRRGPVCGILMPRITGYKEIHKLYSPKNRLLEFPNAGWDFLIHTASNLARAFSVIHELGHAVGDVNHSNIVVSGRATVMLIDCDSCQISCGSKVFTCGVGVSTHQPPELMALDSLDGVKRTPDHDNFGLAVLIFQLLFMGRHPFSGRFDSQEEMQLEKAIIEKSFFYSEPYSSRLGLPPGVLTLKEVSPEIASLFEQAFLNERRPSAKDWVLALENLSKQLKICSCDMSHRYYRALNKCPWCRIEKSTGAMLFSPLAGLYSAKKASEIEDACIRITNFPSPGKAGKLSKHVPFRLRPSLEYIKYSGYWRACLAVIFTSVSWGILLCFGLGIDLVSAAISFLISAAAAVFLPNHVTDEVKAKVKREYDEVDSILKMHLDAWQNENREHKFLERKHQLMEAAEKYKSIDNQRSYKIKDLQSNRRRYQLERYLKAFNISTARIPDVGTSCKTMLRPYGIETAADVDSARLNAVSGLRSDASAGLLKWRKNLEDGFVYNSKRGVGSEEIIKVEKEILAEKTSMEEMLLNGPPELKQISDDIHSQRQCLEEKIKEDKKSYARARANVWAVWGRVKPL
jgi:DNA-binding helix-hairpin-helix protein with protein kinase domain